MNKTAETKMEILDAIADMDPVYQQQMRQLAEKEKKFDKMVATLPDDQRALAWDFVMLCEDMSQRKQYLACKYMEYPGLIYEHPEIQKMAQKVINDALQKRIPPQK